MAHKTLIGGTAYEVSGGKTLVGGTAYSIDKGKTLVGGTAYEVGFMVELRVTGQPMTMPELTCAYIKVPNGEFDPSTLGVNYLVPDGTIIECVVGADKGYNGTVILNGETVLTVEGGKDFLGFVNIGTYIYTVTCNASINIVRNGDQGSGTRQGTITITEL